MRKTLLAVALAAAALAAASAPPATAQVADLQRFLFNIWQQLVNGPVPVKINGPVQVYECPPNPISKIIPPLC